MEVADKFERRRRGRRAPAGTDAKRAYAGRGRGRPKGAELRRAAPSSREEAGEAQRLRGAPKAAARGQQDRRARRAASDRAASRRGSECLRVGEAQRPAASGDSAASARLCGDAQCDLVACSLQRKAWNPPPPPSPPQHSVSS